MRGPRLLLVIVLAIAAMCTAIGGIIAIASPDFGAFIRAQPPTNAVAALTFMLIFAMAFTSIEAVKRKMSARSWKSLHRTGMHFAWIAFAASYSTAIGASVFYAIPTAVLLAIAGIRIAAWVRQRRRVTELASRSRALRA